ncbi:MAG: class I SAM-dependent rRNA methyltransferase [Lachnospiraceae bacterium]|nr:class I SAM-dependent rRNA methyltransferase [Lachnospiraceae bacterium]
MENHTIVTLKKGEGRTLKAGGLWVYDNEIMSIAGTFRNGDIVTVRDFDGFGLGRGFINQNSKIRVRLLTRDVAQEIDDEFLRMRLKNAWEYRKDTVDTGCARLVFGEADFLPGLVVDKFSDVLVIQSLALGMDRMKERVCSLLTDILAADGVAIRGIFERSDARERDREGLPRVKGFLGEEFDTLVPITENGVKYIVDVRDGQKTGFFLDQKYNRLAVQNLCRRLVNPRVLDCFTHTGAFALNAGLAGAADVLGVDASELAIRQAEENARRNGLEERVHFQCADVFELLPELEKRIKKYNSTDGRITTSDEMTDFDKSSEAPEHSTATVEVPERSTAYENLPDILPPYDLVILDPPAFTKSRDSIKNPIKGYREINRNGCKLVRDGGYLATCSCSHFMDQETFAKTIAQAAHAAHKRLRQVEFRTQSPDHPILWAADESYYLKFYIFQVVDEK